MTDKDRLEPNCNLIRNKVLAGQHIEDSDSQYSGGQSDDEVYSFMIRLPGTNKAIPNTDGTFEQLATTKSFKDVHSNQMLSILDIVNGGLNNREFLYAD